MAINKCVTKCIHLLIYFNSVFIMTLKRRHCLLTTTDVLPVITVWCRLEQRAVDDATRKSYYQSGPDPTVY